MAENVNITPGTGDVVGADDISSVKYQRVKIIEGADGVNDGDVSSANPLPVEITDADGSVAANIAAIKTAIEILDNTVSGSETQVDVVAALPAGDNNIGNVDIVTLPGTVASDITAIKTAVEILDNIVSGSEAQVDVVGSLPAGTNNIGDVDVLSIPRSQSGPAEPGTAIDSYTTAAINLTTGANQVLVSSAASKQIWVYGYAFTCGDADGQTVSLQDEDDTALTGVMEFSQYGGISVSPSGNFSMPVFKLATDKDLEIDITGGDVDGWIAYAILSV